MVLAVIVSMATALGCTVAGRGATTTTTTASTTTLPLQFGELDELDVALSADGRLLDVEHGAAGDVFYSKVDFGGIEHVLSDGTSETIGASVWRGRLNAYVGYRQMAVSGDGTLYVADSTTRRVWKVEPQDLPDGRLVYSESTPEVVAGRGEDCRQTVVELYPQTHQNHTGIVGGSCVEYRGWLLDNPDLALNSEQGVPDDGAVATEAILSPWNIEVDATETTLALAEVGAGQGPAVRVVDLRTGMISTEAAWVPGDNSACDHPALAEGRAAVSEQDLWGTHRMPFCNVFDVGFTPGGGIVFAAGSYTSGSGAGAVLGTEGPPGAKTLRVLAGCHGATCTVDGGQGPLGTTVSDMSALDVRGDGSIFLADTANDRVRMLAVGGSQLRTVAGTGRRCSTTGSCPDAVDSPASDPASSELDRPAELSVASDGSLLLAEDQCAWGANHWLRAVH